MLSLLEEELADIGLEMHLLKILSSQHPQGVDLVDIGDAFIQVLDNTEYHHYLGRLLNFDVIKRVGIEFLNRINAVWGKFHQNRK